MSQPDNGGGEDRSGPGTGRGSDSPGPVDTPDPQPYPGHPVPGTSPDKDD